MTRTIHAAMLSLLALIAFPVSAQPTCPGPTHFVFTPQNPSPDETTLLQLVVHGFGTGSGFGRLVVSGIDGTVIAVSATVGTGGGIGISPIPWTEIGPLPAGDYQVQVTTLIFTTNTICPVVTLPLRVGAGAPPPAVAAPVASLPMLVLLILALGGVGWVALRRG